MDDLWVDIGAVTDIPQRGAPKVAAKHGPMAISRRGHGQVFAHI